ncbi:MAG: preprotein translocase subunit SecA [Ruminococcaceae bacterium]|nr:preprotein translocase subunit SecA [Oscillospiraceae bacterium]
MGLITKIFGTYSSRELKRIKPLADKTLALRDKYEKMSDEELKSQTSILKERLNNGETLDDILPDAYAVCSEAQWRVRNERPYPVQIMGAIILHQGRISEMKTGEGKTLTSSLAAYLNALSGKGVHVVTPNEYLAKVGTEWNGKVYRFLGLTVGLIYHDMDNKERKEAYNADITYGTNNEFGFDYLRDNMVIYKERKVQRGHNFAIVDEVDSILIDEARTPLIISGQGDKSTELYKIADGFARTLKRIAVAEVDEKEDSDEIYKDYDYIVNEKHKSATLTQRGIKKAEAFFKLENLSDPDNVTVQHHINQAIKAHGCMKRDINYVVNNGEVIIVDEFTGRLMYGRRYNEGLHQAIEAKEGVKVEKESRTLATITFQNYFRLYKKLSGMTGTALTEQAEFSEIYRLDVVEVPTNRPMIREDCPDVVYKTERAKLLAVVEDIVEHNKKGQPVLVGTVTIEKSELISSLLKKRGVKHEVLNAKYHEKEAEIVAQAGKKGAVTIATNMAGRGTDIKLGGNAEFMALSDMRRQNFEQRLIEEANSFSETSDPEILEARSIFNTLHDKYRAKIKEEAEEVKALGGLYIIGTERHESRRIDNQLRGRAGRQGDPGKSRFYISLEDDLMRLFGGDRVGMLMDRMNFDENIPIEAGIISNSIENAQKKVEGRNFSIRKNVLQYDDVMNRQREIIYSQRDMVLNGENVKEKILNMVMESIEVNTERFISDNAPHAEWDLDSLRSYYSPWLLNEDDLKYSKEDLLGLTSSDVKEYIKEKASELYEKREEEFTPEIMREIERMVLLKNVDTQWMDHIDAMNELQNGIRLRAYGQKDPVVEYKLEGFDMFDQMIAIIRENTARMILTVRIQKQQEVKREEVLKPSQNSGGEKSEIKKAPVKKDKKPGRNDPCPCGSGKKYKKCCGINE